MTTTDNVHLGFDAKMANVCAAAARAVRAKMGKSPCCYCRKHYAPSSRGYDRSSSRCVDRAACLTRVAKHLAGAFGSGKFSPRDGDAVAADYRAAMAS